MKLAVSPGQAQRHLGWRRRREDSATVGGNDPVTSLPLGLIKGCVAGSDQRIAPGDMERSRRAANVTARPEIRIALAAAIVRPFADASTPRNTVILQIP